MARPFFEAATRLLWALSVDDGISKLIWQYAREDEKLAGDISRYFISCQPLSNKILGNRFDILALGEREGWRPVGMLDMIKDIETRLRKDELLSASVNYSQFYPSIFRSLSMHTHAHPSSRLEPGAPLADTAQMCLATFIGTDWLLQSIVRMGLFENERESLLRINEQTNRWVAALQKSFNAISNQQL